MTPKDFTKISLLIIFPLFIILTLILSACSKIEIKESEKIAEEVIEDVAESELER